MRAFVEVLLDRMRRRRPGAVRAAVGAAPGGRRWWPPDRYGDARNGMVMRDNAPGISVTGIQLTGALLAGWSASAGSTR